jgi:hypothetical protein
MDLDRVVQWTQKWRKGTWKEDGYHNQDGELLADMSLALSCETDTVPNASSCPILYIGASRTKNTADAVKDKKVYFYYCGGAGFRWFFNPTFHYGRRIEPAFQVIRTYLARRPSGTVIIDLGGNDLSNIEAYVGFYRKLLSLYPEGKIWFMGVLPRKKGNATNSRRREFNMRLDRELPGHVINLYDWVYKQRDFKTKDGIHYYPRFSRKIYKKTMEKIGCKVTVNMKTGRVKHK